MARKNGFEWDKGKDPARVFGTAVQRYARAINDANYRLMVMEAPTLQEVLREVGTWDDNGAAGGDFIRAQAITDANRYVAGIEVWYDLEGYRVLHPKEDPDFTWEAIHIRRRNREATSIEYEARLSVHYQYEAAVDRFKQEGVDDRVVETFEDNARYLWDQVLAGLR